MAVSSVWTNARSGNIAAGMLFGLAMSTAGASATFSVAPGFAADSTGLARISLAASLAKTTAAWVAGAGGALLDGGSIAANVWYHVFLIYNPTTGAADVGVSQGASGTRVPNALPSGYTFYRCIGSMRTNASLQWLGFTQLGDEFLFKAAALEQNSVVPTTPTLLTLTYVPNGVQVFAKLRGIISGPNVPAVLFQSPDETPALVNSPAGNMDATASANSQAGFNVTVRTNTAKQVLWNAILASTSCSLVAYGWNDPRGKND